jgi:hypothetical protein
VRRAERVTEVPQFRLEPVAYPKEVSNSLRHRPIEDVQALAPVDDQARLAQARQLLREIGLTKSEPRLEVTDACLALRHQDSKYFQPNRVPQRSENPCCSPPVFHLRLPSYSVFAIQNKLGGGSRLVTTVTNRGGVVSYVVVEIGFAGKAIVCFLE